MTTATILPVTPAPGGYAGAGTTLTFTAADMVNGNRFLATGHELLLVQNTALDDALARGLSDDSDSDPVTIFSSPDPYGRLGDIVAEGIAFQSIHTFGPFPLLGWQQSDGYLHLSAITDNLTVAVIQLP